MRMTFPFTTLITIRLTPSADPSRTPILRTEAGIKDATMVPVLVLGDMWLLSCIPYKNDQDIVVIQAHTSSF